MHQTFQPSSVIAGRKHLDPRCTCRACLVFDHSTTRPMQRLAPRTVEQVNAFESETGEAFTYYFPVETAQAAPKRVPEPLQLSSAAPRWQPKQHSTAYQEQTLHSLLVPTLLQKFQASIEKHPCLWLGISCVLSCFHLL
jgi:hypothetical protein